MLNTGGLLESKRSDGVTNFGQNATTNDIVLKLKENLNSVSSSYFSVNFNTIHNKYYLRNECSENDIDSNILIKVKKHNITDKEILVVGKYRFGIEVEKRNQSIKIEYGLLNGYQSTKIFLREKERIVVGRKKHSDIILDDISYAKIEFSVEYKDKNWIINEGNGSQFGMFMLLGRKTQMEIMNNMQMKLKNSTYVFEYSDKNKIN